MLLGIFAQFVPNLFMTLEAFGGILMKILLQPQCLKHIKTSW
jgi:hypothetical protein